MQEFAVRLLADRVADDVRFLRARLPQQVDPHSIAEIDLGAEFLRQVDLVRLVVDQRDVDIAQHQHLRHSLPEAAIADDDRTCAIAVRLLAGFVALRLHPDAAGGHHQERRGGHGNGHHGAEQAGGFRIQQSAALRLRVENEGELAALAQQQAKCECGAPCHLQQQAEAHDDGRLDRDQRRRHAEHEAGPLRHRAKVQHHADRKEEQAEQDRTERFDIRLQLVPVRRVRQHDAGDEGSQRGGEPEGFHHRCAGEHGEEARDHEHLPLPQPADQAVERAQQEAARRDQADDRNQCEEH